MGGLNSRRTSRSFVRSVFPLSTVEDLTADGVPRFVVLTEPGKLAITGSAYASSRREAWSEAHAAVIREAERLGIAVGSR